MTYHFEAKHVITDLLHDEPAFVRRVVQPGLAGLMDGSVSTLAPIFATAFATHRSQTTFLIGTAAAVGAGISMAFAEGLSDDGELTGRGKPLLRGFITGVMTFLGAILHTCPSCCITFISLSTPRTLLSGSNSWPYLGFDTATCGRALFAHVSRSLLVEASCLLQAP